MVLQRHADTPGITSNTCYSNRNLNSNIRQAAQYCTAPALKTRFPSATIWQWVLDPTNGFAK